MTSYGPSTLLPDAERTARSGPGSSARTGGLAGLGSLLRLQLRLDRFRLSLWFIGIVGLTAATCQSLASLYDTQAELDGYGTLVRDNAALIVQAGPGYGLDDPTLGSVTMNELGIWIIIAFAVMNLFGIVRHTRTAEETNRAELLRAAPIGRHASLTAAFAGMAISDLVIAGGIVATLVAYGLPTVGSLAFGSTLVASGMVFATVAAVASQVAERSRAALGLGGIVIAVSFVLRAVGDVGDGRLSWLSPLGWAQAIRAFANERWWVLALQLGVAGVVALVAVSLEDRRDHGAGMLPQRAGRPEASDRLASPLGLAFRLHRSSIVGWSLSLGVFGFFYGIVADQAESIIEDSPDMADFFAQLGNASITDAFLSTSVLILALIASAFSVSSVLRLRREETSTHADVILSTATSRRSWAASHLVVASIGSLVVMTATGLGVGAGYAVMTGDLSDAPPLLAAALVMTPALFVMSAAAFSVVAIAPRFAPSAWGLVLFAFAVGIFGSVLHLPTWVHDLSPFQHVPAMPAESFDAVPVVVLLAVATALSALAFAALDRRDIALS
jgi:polyether ionophore transport system permease protein